MEEVGWAGHHTLYRKTEEQRRTTGEDRGRGERRQWDNIEEIHSIA
jgi:hypothetical protein